MATRRRSRLITLVLAGALVFGMLLVPASAPAVGTCVTPPTTVPVSSLTPGMMATGWTAVQGQAPESFDVEILGVLPDGIAPGLDFVLIEVSGPVVDEFGGIASGMSGSPVYIGSDLVGAVSYGFFGGDHFIGGLTPAEEMVKLFDYPDATPPLAATSVELSPELKAAVAAAEGVPVRKAPGVAEQLPMPLAVSGLSKHGMDRLERRLAERELAVIPYRAGSVAAPEPGAPITGTQPQPGEPVAGLLSFGDLSWGGVGTQTAVCGDLSIAFGHPLGWFGRTGMSMNEASVLKVISDPSGLWGPFKLATVGDPAGMIDQDRMAGIRGFAGVEPESMEIQTTLDNADLGTITEGATTVITPMFLPDLSAFHLMQAIWDANDSYWEGTANLHWQIDGLREDGTPFSVIHDDAFFNGYDVGWEAAMYLWYDIGVLFYNETEQVTITGVEVTGDVSQDRLTGHIAEVRTKSSLQPGMKERKRLLVRGGTKIRIQVDVNPYGPDPVRTENLQIDVPRDMGGQMRLIVSDGSSIGGGDGYYGYYYGYGYGGGDQTFDELIDSLNTRHSHTDLAAVLYSLDEEDPTDPVSEDVRPQSEVIAGYRGIKVRVV